MALELSEKARKSLSSNGKDFIKEVGLDIVKNVVVDVLTGKNLRDSTELLTRKKILAINAATLVMLLNGSSKNSDFIAKLPDTAFEKLTSKGLKKQDRWLMQWVLGLTDKAFQNVLRDDKAGLEKYKEDFVHILTDSIQEFYNEYGDLRGTLTLGNKHSSVVDWQFFSQLSTILGSQTLAIRGSNKSTFGKLFEKLILGSLLSMLGFKLVSKDDLNETRGVFWLSSREDKRESDATLLLDAGKGIRFDIGFIGRGNPEISLDKVSRFERELERGRQKWYLATIIIVDRIGTKSNIENLAAKIDGNIVQMSGAYWPLKVAQILHDKIGYKGDILNQSTSTIGPWLTEKIALVPFDKMLDLPIFEDIEETAD